MARTSQVTTAASPAYDEAARKRKIADALAAASMAPRQVQPAETWTYLANGLTQLGQAAIARNAGKKATAAQQGADSQMQDVNRAAIEKLVGAYQVEDPNGGAPTPLAGGTLPGSKIEAGLAGIDPRQANGVIAQALMQQNMPKEQKLTAVPYGAMMVDQNGKTVTTNNRIPGVGARSKESQWMTEYVAAHPEADFDAASKAYAEWKLSTMPAPAPNAVTPVTIASKDDPARGVIVDARTSRTIGDAPVTAATTKAAAAKAGASKDVDTARTQAKNTIDDIDAILSPDRKDGFEANFGGWNAKASRLMPGENVAFVRNKLGSVKANMKSLGLSLVRAGGGIGAITEKEWPILEQMVDAIDPTLSEADAKKGLQDFKVQLQGTIDRIGAAYQQQYGEEALNTAAGVTPKETAAERAKKMGL